MEKQGQCKPGIVTYFSLLGYFFEDPRILKSFSIAIQGLSSPRSAKKQETALLQIKIDSLEIWTLTDGW